MVGVWNLGKLKVLALQKAHEVLLLNNTADNLPERIDTFELAGCKPLKKPLLPIQRLKVKTDDLAPRNELKFGNQTEFQDVLLPWDLSWVNSTGAQRDASDEGLVVEDIIQKTVQQWSEIFA
ncbi:hypothetical protein J3E69DRAFT_108937 [Trichoderma sp. SZMC 28015]